MLLYNNSDMEGFSLSLGLIYKRFLQKNRTILIMIY